MSILGLVTPAQANARLPPLAKAANAFTLYGDAATGWGNGRTNISNPGPTLYVHQGENVSITLFAADGALHNWYIDFNGNVRVDAGEISSPDFSSSSTAIVFNFTVPKDRIGPFTYRCRIHPTLMTGQIVILTPPVVTLYGSASNGWSFMSNKTTPGPGPALYMLFGTNLTIHLVSRDGAIVGHTWFVDYNNDSASTGEPTSKTFNTTTPLTYVFSPDRTGTFEYRCSFHPNTMTGVIVVAGNAAPPRQGPQFNLVQGIMIGTILSVLALAAVYQVRAVRVARRHR